MAKALVHNKLSHLLFRILSLRNDTLEHMLNEKIMSMNVVLMVNTNIMFLFYLHESQYCFTCKNETGDSDSTT